MYRITPGNGEIVIGAPPGGVIWIATSSPNVAPLIAVIEPVIFSDLTMPAAVGVTDTTRFTPLPFGPSLISGAGSEAGGSTRVSMGDASAPPHNARSNAGPQAFEPFRMIVTPQINVSGQAAPPNGGDLKRPTQHGEHSTKKTPWDPKFPILTPTPYGSNHVLPRPR